MNRQEISLKSTTLIIDQQQFRIVRGKELTKKMGYSKRHMAEDKKIGFVDQVEVDRRTELTLQRESLLEIYLIQRSQRFEIGE